MKHLDQMKSFEILDEEQLKNIGSESGGNNLGVGGGDLCGDKPDKVLFPEQYQAWVICKIGSPIPNNPNNN